MACFTLASGEFRLQFTRVSVQDEAGMIHELIEAFQHTQDPRRLTALVPSLQRRLPRKGDLLLAQGTLWDQAFIVERGLLRVHRSDRSGRDFNQAFYPEGTGLLPLTPELEEQPSAFSISALEPSIVWQAPVSSVRSSVAAHDLWEPFKKHLLAMLLDRKLARETDLLTLDGTARYQQLCHRHPELVGRVPLFHLASYLGLTDVSLSRIRRQRTAEPQ